MQTDDRLWSAVHTLHIAPTWRRMRLASGARVPRWLILWLLVLAVVVLLVIELHTSRLQARWLTALAREASFELDTGPSPPDRIRFPEAGPYDWRLGYARLPEFLDRLARDYLVVAQARSSPGLVRLIDRGLYPIYEEKTQAGLEITDAAGRQLFQQRYPSRVYREFAEIPSVVVRTLLFLENRELLDSRAPYRNPAIEWDRLLRAGFHQSARQVSPSVPRLGGSTLATQLEKIRHSPDGVTRSVSDKVRQVASASVRAYLHGEQTLDTQRQIITAYLNGLPLAALPGYGEVVGLGDGLWAWYGGDWARTNRLLHALDTAGVDASVVDAALAYRQVVSLLVAIRRPSDYLVRNPDRLDRDTDALLADLARGRIVSPRVAAVARVARPSLNQSVGSPDASFQDHKPSARIRAKMADTLGIQSLYELDRLDLTLTSTLDQRVQQAVTETFRRLADPEELAGTSLQGPRLLRDGDPARVVYSLVLYERKGDANLLRVQADSLDQPLDVNDSTKLELGSTAKLRVLVSYLEVVASLHAEHIGRSASEIATARGEAHDPVTIWVLDYLGRHPAVSLAALLEAALERRYSASPHESFFTGGGMHRFANYDARDNTRVMSVREGFRQSVNLVFIRVLRDIARFHLVRLPGWSPALLDDRTHPGRLAYLERFADREGRVFLERFLRRYEGMSADDALARLAADGPQTPIRLAAIHRSVRPEASLDDFSAYLRAQLGSVSANDAARLYVEYQADRWTLADQGVLARRHPLEVWLLADRERHPGSTHREVIARSAAARRASYRWLFKTSREDAQDRRIREELERDAFRMIHQSWARLGYPFDSLVPSYATAVGSSGDNPTGLAELMGIIQNGGLRLPSRRVASLRFGEGTPTETRLVPRRQQATQVLDPIVAEVIRRELIGVVEHGTGRRAAGALTLADGTPLEVGGKTGTGDNRVRSGNRGTTRVLNRTAVFTFLFGDRFFGVVTAYVDQAAAAEYRFTSALAVQVFKDLGPTLLSLTSAPASDAVHETGQLGARSSPDDRRAPAFVTSLSSTSYGWAPTTPCRPVTNVGTPVMPYWRDLSQSASTASRQRRSTTTSRASEPGNPTDSASCTSSSTFAIFRFSTKYARNSVSWMA